MTDKHQVECANCLLYTKMIRTLYMQALTADREMHRGINGTETSVELHTNLYRGRVRVISLNNQNKTMKLAMRLQPLLNR